MLIRQKDTRIEETLPPVSELLADKPASQWYVDIHGRDVKLDFKDLVEHDPWPIPLPVDREGYNTVDTSHSYWASGHTDWLNVKSAVAEFDITSQQKLRILDMGCASGRFLRHVCAFGDDDFDIWGADLASANIAWIKKYLPSQIKAITNTAIPHLPFPDGYFDVITGFSLMPHIDELEDAWLLEMRRIIKPDGLLYLTIANEGTWSAAAERESTVNHFVRTNAVPGNDPINRAIFERPMPAERFVRRTSDTPVYNCYIWHSSRYVQEWWSRYFYVHRIVNFGHLRHQAVVLSQPL